MTGVEWMLLLIGAVFMIGSFFVTEKLSPSELNQIAELSEDELKKIIERGMNNARGRIDDQIEEQLDASMEKVDRALEKETNSKIMAISDYSDTVLDSMNKTHNEIMFLYSMLNDKHTELTGMVSDLQRLAADVRNLEENMNVSPMTDTSANTVTINPTVAAMQMTKKAAPEVPVAASTVNADSMPEEEKKETAESVQKVPQKQTERANVQRQILALHKEGLSDVEIARNLGMGVGEVRLVIGLYRGE